MPKGKNETTKINVLIMNLYTEMGGGEYAIYNLLKELNRDRFKPIMMFNKRGQFVEKVEALGIETVIIPFPVVMLKRLVSPAVFLSCVKASQQIHRYIRQKDIDIVQCSDVLSLILLAYPVMRSRIPVLYNVIYFYEWSRLLLFNFLALFFVDEVIANSIAVKEDIIRKTIFLSHRIEVFYLGVDLNLFRPRNSNDPDLLRKELGLDPTIKLLGMISRFEPLKGHKYFLQAVPHVLRIRQDVKFLIVGGVLFRDVFLFFEKYHNDILECYDKLNLHDSVRFLPHRNNIQELMRNLDLLVCPSLYEGFGLVVLEALASGVPVVASRSVGALEIVHDLPGVFVSEPADEQSLAKAMLSAIDFVDQTNPNKMGDHGFNKTLDTVKQFEWSHYRKQMERIYLGEATKEKIH